MARGGSARPSGGDGRKPSAGPAKGNGGFSFSWSAPSPSAADILEMERRFPEIIQLPSAAIDREAEDWAASGLIVRPLSRWVPPDAVLREFRRAGLAGGIEVIQLAHRILLLKFELAESRIAALRQPWIVNGQPLAMEPWRPDFIPGEDAICAALLWIRLPQLPIEYWTEESLRCILSTAGTFVEADAFTMERRRGSYARACVRVDLRIALRPGARIRSNGAAFWQGFVYEHVDCICSRCATVHLQGPCSSSPDPASSAEAPFGPWMAALRRRNVPSGKVASGEVRPNSSVGSPLASSSVELRAEQRSDQGGWMTPRKTSRRKAVPAPSLGIVSIPSPVDQLPKSSDQILSGSQRGKGPCREIVNVPVTVHPVTALIPESLSEASSPHLALIKKGKRIPLNPLIQGNQQPLATPVFHFEATPGDLRSVIPLEAQKTVKGKPSNNPFKALGLDRSAGTSKVKADVNPTSLKRARTTESSGPRLSPKAMKGKSRGPALGKSPSSIMDLPLALASPQGTLADGSAPLDSVPTPGPGVRVDSLMLEQGTQELGADLDGDTDRVMMVALDEA